MAKLSVVIPTFNRGSLVKQAVDSVLSQESNHEIEVIVVDDGSTDDTRQVLEGYGTRITYLHQENRGMNAARNLGIASARGQYVSLLDSDDVWLPFKASLQISVMDKLDSVGYAFSNFFIWRNGSRIADGLSSWMLAGQSIAQHATESMSSTDLHLTGPTLFNVNVCDVYLLSMYQPVVLPSTSIIRRTVLEALGPLPEDNWMCGDWEYFAKASKQFGSAYIDIETTLNRSHDDPVRLMRRDLADRTKLRLESIQRTWKADPDFMAEHAHDVARVESNEWKVLYKRACYDNNLLEAKTYLANIKAFLGYVPLPLLVLYAIVRIPAGARALNFTRRVVLGSSFD
jgi:glycosyltransferase involved in cell wall biosynthesis